MAIVEWGVYAMNKRRDSGDEKRGRREISVNEVGQILKDEAVVSGVRFPVKWEWKPRVKGLSIEESDLNAPQILGTLFAASSLESCRFSKVNFDGCRIKKTRFIGCEFSNCVFGDRLVSGIRSAAFESCQFIGCVANGVIFDDTSFGDCEFVDLESEESRWERCRLERVKGTGTLKGVTIISCTFVDVDWSAMRLIDSNNVKNEFQRSRMPSRPDNFVINTSVLPSASAMLEGRMSENGYEEYERLAAFYAKQPTDEFFDETRLEHLSRDDRRVVMSVLYESRDRRFD